MKHLTFPFAVAMFLFINLNAQNHSLDFLSTSDNKVSLSGLNLTGSFTIEAWVKPNLKTDFNTILSNKIGGEHNPGFSFAINHYQTSDRKLVLETKNAFIATNDAVITWGIWQHVAVTYDGVAGKYYVNGVEQAATGSVVLEAGSSTFIGDWANYSLNGRYDGVMDELRVWNVARTQSEIQNNMYGELSSIPASLIGYYKFNHGTNPGGNNTGQTSLTDHAGGDNNGTLQNFSLNGSRSNWIAESPLPVELTLLSAKVVENKTSLRWETASEQSNRGFEVQRSGDSKNWNTLAFVQGHGTTYLKHSYLFIDPQPLTGLNYYRLKQMDFGGRFEYSKTVVVEYRVGGSTFFLYPNPAKDHVGLTLTSDFTGEAILTLVGSDGKNIMTRLIESESGSNHTNLTFDHIRPGVYVLNLQLGHEILQQRLIVRQ